MIFNEQISEVVKLLQEARRPVFIWGAGVRPYATDALALARSLGVPVACTWGAIDLINHDDALMAGGFGTHGTRAANFTVQNSDLIVSIGSRLDTKATGNVGHFARNARLVVVDIDRPELGKLEQLGRRVDVPICMDAGEFIEALGKVYPDGGFDEWCEWANKIHAWRKRYDTPTVTWPGINPYELMKEIGKWTTADDVIVSDTGTALGYVMQGFPFKGERFLHAFNMTPMGYGLPAAIGSSFATGKRVVLITGDGSLMMSLPELATVARWNLNIKIILLNNGGHAMCRQTQRQWLYGKYYSTSVEGGLGFPDFFEAAISFGFEDRTFCYLPESSNIENDESLEYFFTSNGRTFLEVEIHPDAHLMPQAAFGVPLEDGDPKLPREELRAQMLIPLIND